VSRSKSTIAASAAAWGSSFKTRARRLFQLSLHESPAWLLSAVFHGALLIALGLWMLPQIQEKVRDLVATTIADDRFDLEELTAPNQLEQPPAETTNEAMPAVIADTIAESVEISPLEETPAPPLAIDVDALGPDMLPKSELASEVGLFGGRGLEGRGEAARKILVAQRGGTVASEEAVNLSLNWFIEHQLPDGSWSFDHRQSPSCQGQCGDPGILRGGVGATALALLPFLGAGQTHLRGKYAGQIEAGLNFLVGSMKLGPQGGNLMDDGRMYSHGLAAIALCEAYALTQDRRLHAPAQQAINFIVNAQDKRGGGWRYEPGQPGDTSVTGWQLMALKSAHMAYLEMPLENVEAVSRFLDRVAIDGGYAYGYMEKSIRPGTTAVGLLCRMYLGWPRDNDALVRGAKYLADQGPSRGDFYYNYYATQVLAHFEGDLWQKWNKAMRDYYVQTQAKQGHEAGSWFVPSDPHGAKPGGRLYMTSMACMTLEVYYRHLPLYREESVKDAFE
jgi:hypothetical protein